MSITRAESSLCLFQKQIGLWWAKKKPHPKNKQKTPMHTAKKEERKRDRQRERGNNNNNFDLMLSRKMSGSKMFSKR